MAIEKLDQAKEKLKHGNLYLDNGDYKRSLESFQNVESMGNSIEQDLELISQSIRDAKELDRPKTCFLFWCW